MALVSVEAESLGHFIWVNRTLCEIAGLSKERLLGLNVAAIAGDEDVASATAGIRRLLAGNEPVYSIERRYARPDASVVWVELRMSLIRDESGDPLNFLAQVVDLTERKQAGEARAHLAAIVESSGDAIVGQDLDGTIVSWNRGAERLYGYPAAEVVGKPISVLMSEDRSYELDGIPGRIRRGERVESLETVHRDRNGDWIDVSLSMSPVIGPDGQVNGVAAIARDITERKENEAQLQFLADHDVLTGLFNRRRFIDTLSHHIDLVNRYGPGGAVLILDLDNFKEINDTLGHSAGDETIRAAERGARTQASIKRRRGSARGRRVRGAPRPGRRERVAPSGRRPAGAVAPAARLRRRTQRPGHGKRGRGALRARPAAGFGRPPGERRPGDV